MIWPVDEVHEGGPADDLQRNIDAREGGAAVDISDIMIGVRVSIEIIQVGILGRKGFKLKVGIIFYFILFPL